LSPPAATLRLFPHYAADLTPQRAASLLIARLLEDGDAVDLAWLLQTIPEPALADWFALHGGRQLSVRSRAFWAIALGRAPGPAGAENAALWPL
jgi:hypothetical protein